MEHLYSTIFIVDISQNPDEVDTVASRIQQLIEDYGGVIKKIDRWGKRRLAYPIRKKTHGFYVEIEFSANSHLNIPKILENEYRLNDRVIRYLTYVISKRELLQRAKNAGKAAAAAAPPAPAAPEEKTPSAAPEKAPEVAPVETETTPVESSIEEAKSPEAVVEESTPEAAAPEEEVAATPGVEEKTDAEPAEKTPRPEEKEKKESEDK